MIVFDTNVVSELMRPEPSPLVVAWVLEQSIEGRWTTSITVVEVLFGVKRLPAGRRQESLALAAHELFSAFAGQVLSFDRAAAEEYASLVSAREASGRPIDALDGQIAAICRAHGATLATRNTRDFAGSGIDVADPWAPRT